MLSSSIREHSAVTVGKWCQCDGRRAVGGGWWMPVGPWNLFRRNRIRGCLAYVGFKRLEMANA